jgi:hypothetical protein
MAARLALPFPLPTRGKFGGLPKTEAFHRRSNSARLLNMAASRWEMLRRMFVIDPEFHQCVRDDLERNPCR